MADAITPKRRIVQLSLERASSADKSEEVPPVFVIIRYKGVKVARVKHTGIDLYDSVDRALTAADRSIDTKHLDKS